MTRREFLAACGAAAWQSGGAAPRGQRRGAAGPPSLVVSQRVKVLQSSGSIPPDIVGAFREPSAFQQASSGQYFVLDRGTHSVFGIDAQMQGAWKIVQIGHESGRLLDPTAFSLAPDGTFIVADRPVAAERVQLFGSGGALLGGFTLPGRAAETVTLDGVVLNGIGSLQFRNRAVFINQPETGALISEYTLQGAVTRTFGTLRPTGQEGDPDVHLALNAGLPLVDPTGGFYFVFHAGAPMFRKLDASGASVFERHIEGPELDETIKALPTTWPKRRDQANRLLPVVRPVVRTAAVDATGRLWVAFVGIPVVYVYDALGERTRVVQLRGAGTIVPRGLAFTPDGHLLVVPGCYVFDPR